MWHGARRLAPTGAYGVRAAHALSKWALREDVTKRGQGASGRHSQRPCGAGEGGSCPGAPIATGRCGAAGPCRSRTQSERAEKRAASTDTGGCGQQAVVLTIPSTVNSMGDHQPTTSRPHVTTTPTALASDIPHWRLLSPRPGAPSTQARRRRRPRGPAGEYPARRMPGPYGSRPPKGASGGSVLTLSIGRGTDQPQGEAPAQRSSWRALRGDGGT